MAGFTPINPRVSTQPQQPATRRTSVKSKTADSQIKAAEDGNDAAQGTKPSRSNKTTGKGKKRAATTSAASKPKRQKSDLSSTMQVAKPGIHSTVSTADKEDGVQQSHPNPFQTQDAVSAASRDKLNAFRFTNPDKSQSSKVTVYAQPTSMGLMQSSGPMTSMQALKNPAAHGTTVYSSSSTPSLPASSNTAIRPQKVVDSGNLSVGANVRVTRTSKDRSNRAMPSQSRPAAADERPYPASEHRHEGGAHNIQGSRYTERPIPVASLPSTQFDDDLGDDGIDEADIASLNFVESSADDTRVSMSHNNQLLTPLNSDAIVKIQPSELPCDSGKDANEEFTILNEEDELQLINLTDEVEETEEEPMVPPRDWKLNIRQVEEHEDYGGALLTQSERELLDRIKANADGGEKVKPIIRKPFPNPVFDRSPLFGVSNTSVLRTCFRVGEAMNAGCNAVRNNKNVIIELYARVTASWREPKPGRKQHFILSDLYHDKPPYLNGAFQLWDQSKLWDSDSKPFLTPQQGGHICRVIARMKRDGTLWRLDILSIWQASWNDVMHVAGIYAKDDEVV